jgi:hypothetical protein
MNDIAVIGAEAVSDVHWMKATGSVVFNPLCRHPYMTIDSARGHGLY